MKPNPIFTIIEYYDIHNNNKLENINRVGFTNRINRDTCNEGVEDLASPLFSNVSVFQFALKNNAYSVKYGLFIRLYKSPKTKTRIETKTNQNNIIYVLFYIIVIIILII